jgi:hypothetical protein
VRDTFQEFDAASAIRVGPSLREPWFVLLLILALVALLAGGAMFGFRHPLAPAIAILGACGLVGAFVAMLVIKRRQKLVWLDEWSFIVRDARGERRYRHDQVICASHWARPNFMNGVYKSTTLMLDVWVQSAEGAERLLLARVVAPGEEDPLAPLVDRIFDALYAAARAALAAGGPFEGENFVLDAGQLTVTRGRETVQVDLQHLAAAEVVDDQLCVWRHREIEPLARVDLRWANAPVLARLLEERPAAEPQSEGEPGSSLGRLLFERRPAPALAFFIWLVPLAAVAIVAFLVLVAAVRKEPAVLIVAGALVMIGGGLTLLLMYFNVRFRCHERGVTIATRLYQRSMRFDEVTSFSCAASRQYVKGVYTGTRYTLTFLAQHAGKQRKLAYSRTLRNADQELDHLRDRVAALLAVEKLERLHRGQPVSWTEGLRLLPDGLEFKPAGFLGRKKPVVIPYDQIAGSSIDDGHFYVWLNGQKKPFIKENCNGLDFFPGHCAFLVWLGSAESRAAVAPADAAQASSPAGNVE